MSEWQDISTAPRDGSKIDLWVVDFAFGEGGRVTRSDGERMVNAWWGKTYFFRDKGQSAEGEEDEWVITERYGPGINVEPVESNSGRRVTHWMPLPPPPGAT